MWIDVAAPAYLALLPLCAGMIYALWRLHPGKGRKAKLSHALRYAITALLVLALSGVSVLSGTGEKATWLVLDASDSMKRAGDSVSLAQAALDALPQDRQAGVIVFGENAMVEETLSQHPAFSGVTARVNRAGSNLAEAIALAGALLPSDADGGVAVISDGLVDTVDASALRERGVAVNVLETAGNGVARDAQITAVSLPASVYQGQAFSVTVTAHATDAGEATMLLYENRSVIASKKVTLRAGENTFVFPCAASAAGVATYEAQVLLPGDSVEENNRLGAYTAVSGAPHVLLAEGKSGQGRELKKLLEAAGMQAEVCLPGMLPAAAEGYMAYQAAALVNVDADDLTDAQIAALSAAALELGKGVAVFGGDSSYALGNYRGSALEEMLPVTIDVKNKLDLPTTALLLVIDHSGSMADGQYGVTRLDVAKEAACRAIEVLTPRDQAGVIAFDDAAKWVVPLSLAEDVSAMQQSIATIRPGGGTSFFSPLQMAYQALKDANAQHKHVIFLTDGEAGDSGYDTIAAAMAQEGITLTTVAVGDGADTYTLKKLAEKGGGRAYAAGEFDNVPKIFTKETLLISGTYVQNRTFTPIITDASMTDFPGFPTLDGYLATAEKPLATVSLISDREEPILAWWQYGAGKVLCWTSDVQGAWSSSFLQWDQATAFFGGLVSFILPVRQAEGEAALEDGTLVYRAPGSTEGRATARVLAPDGSVSVLEMEQVAPDRFEAALENAQPGAYAVSVTVRQTDQADLTFEGGVTAPYSREYDLRVGNQGALARLAADTGGQAVSDAGQLLTFPPAQARARHALRPYLTLAALALLLLDIAQRRLDWEKLTDPQERPVPAKRPAKPPRHPKKTTVQSPSGETSQQLWDNLQKKKRM